MAPILEVQEGPELVSSVSDKQVTDYRQWELATAELRVHVLIINDKSPFICAWLWHKKPLADPMELAGHNPALFLKLFFFSSRMASSLRPTAQMGLSASGLASGIGSKTQIALGPRLSMFFSISDQ